jgi:putative tryptophan/tyrosine transport system substrate-binding protein
MMRRAFIAGLGSTAALCANWQLAARAQQSALPVIGYLATQSPDTFSDNDAAFRRALGEAGFAIGHTHRSAPYIVRRHTRGAS